MLRIDVTPRYAAASARPAAAFVCREQGIDMLNDLYHMLDPVAISAGPITIYWYGLAYVVGALLTAEIGRAHV